MNADMLIESARTWERDWGERRTSGLITALADLAESEGKRADDAEHDRAELREKHNSAVSDLIMQVNVVTGERDAALADLARLKGQQP